MASPCNNLNVVPIKVSQLVRYKNLDQDDIILTIESGSKLISRRSTIGDLKRSFSQLTGSYTGSLSGSFIGKASGSFSGSYWGSVVSKNTKASGSFKGNFKGDVSGSFSGSILSKNTKATGSFYGNKSTISGSFSGSYWGRVISKNTKSSGSFSGSYWGQLISKNTKATGSFSGSYWGQVISKNTKATGSFSGSFIGSKSKLTGSFSGSIFGKIIAKNSLITGSFRGIDYINNFKNSGKNVSFNGTSSYSVSSSYAQTASYVSSGGIFAHASWSGSAAGSTTFSSNNVASIVFTGTPPSSPDTLGAIRYTTITFNTSTGAAGTKNYTVLSYCSWDNPNMYGDISTLQGRKHFADIGTSVVYDRTNTGFKIIVYSGWYAGTAGDGDDYWYNTSIFPDYNSFIVVK